MIPYPIDPKNPMNSSSELVIYEDFSKLNVKLAYRH